MFVVLDVEENKLRAAQSLKLLM